MPPGVQLSTMMIASAILALVPLAAPASEKEDLNAAIRAYFATTDRSEKHAFLSRIRTASEGSIGVTAGALADISLWPAIEGSTDTLAVDLGGGAQSAIAVALPSGYDPALRYPLLLMLSDGTDSDGLDSPASGFVVARITGLGRLGFNAPRRFADAPRRWLAALRKRYHIDTDRVYVDGRGLGGDAAFAMAVMHADAFAGVIIREGTLLVPYPRELQPLLLANLRDTPLHLAWTRPDLPANTVLRGRAVRVALMNQLIAKNAARASLPITTTVVRESGAVSPDVWNHILRSRRVRVTTESRRFRYPEQARTRLVNVRRFTGPVWEGDQLDILTRSEADPGAFVTKVLESKLGQLVVRVDGQTLDVRCPHCDAIEIRLGLGDVDFARPILIRFNGKRRFSGRLTPSIETLLRSADASWEFQHPACVRLRIGRKGSAIPF